MKYYAPTPVTISVINAAGWDANLLVPPGSTIEITDATCFGQVAKGVMMTLGGTP